MKSVDYLSIFLLIGAAPTWQAELDRLSAGMGSALLIILLLTAVRLVQSEIAGGKSRIAKTGHTTARQCGLPFACFKCSQPCREA